MYMCPTGKCVHQCTDYGFVDFKYFVIVLYNNIWNPDYIYDNMDRTGWQLQVIYEDCGVTSKKVLSFWIHHPFYAMIHPFMFLESVQGRRQRYGRDGHGRTGFLRKKNGFA